MSSERLHIHIGVNFFGAGNIGDDLMMAGFLQALGQRIERTHITCCTAHDLISQARRFPSIDWQPDTESNQARATGACDIWLALGDTPFQLQSGLWMRDHLHKQMAIAKQYDKPMFYLGVGVEDSNTFDDLRYRQLAKGAAHIWTRDSASTNILGGLGLDSVTQGADLSHAFLSSLSHNKIDPISELSLLLASEQRDFSDEVGSAISQLVSDQKITWLIQDVRCFSGSERSIFDSLPSLQQARMSVASPDYQSPSIHELMAAWPYTRVAASSRYHGLCIHAWRGANLVAIERSGKIAAVAKGFNIPLMPVSALSTSLDLARPVERDLLQQMANSALHMVDDFCRVVGLNHPAATGSTQSRTVSSPASSIADSSDVIAMNIAVVKHDSIGDFVLLTPFMRELRRLWPAAHVTLYVRAPAAELARLCPYADRVVVSDGLSQMPSTSSLAIPLGGYDLVFVPRAAKDYFYGLNLVSQIGGRQRWGFAGTAMDEFENGALTHEIRIPAAETHARMNLALLSEFSDQRLDDSLESWPRQKCVDQWRDNLRIPFDERPLCMIGFSAQHISNVWNHENFVTVIQQLLHSYRLVPVLVGGSDVHTLARKIASRFPEDSVLNLTGFSLEDVCAVSSFASLYIGNDTGPKHIAAAANVPIVEINPYPLGSVAFIEAGPAHFHPHRVPHFILQPPAGTPDELVSSGTAINLIEPTDVLEAVERLLIVAGHTKHERPTTSFVQHGDILAKTRESIARINVERRKVENAIEDRWRHQIRSFIKREAGETFLDRDIDSFWTAIVELNRDRHTRLDVIVKQQQLIDELKTQLEVSEDDRKARLDVIVRQQQFLDELKAQLETSENDRKAHLDVIVGQKRRLEEIEILLSESNRRLDGLFDAVDSSRWIHIGSFLRLTRIRRALQADRAKHRP